MKYILNPIIRWIEVLLIILLYYPLKTICAVTEYLWNFDTIVFKRMYFTNFYTVCLKGTYTARIYRTRQDYLNHKYDVCMVEELYKIDEER